MPVMERQDIRQQLLEKGVDDEVVSDILNKIRARRANRTSISSKKISAPVTPDFVDEVSSVASTSNPSKKTAAPVTPDSCDDAFSSLASPLQGAAIPQSQDISAPLSPGRHVTESGVHALPLHDNAIYGKVETHDSPEEFPHRTRSKQLVRFSRRSRKIPKRIPPSPPTRNFRETERYHVEFLSDSLLPGETVTKRNRAEGKKYVEKYEMVPYVEPKNVHFRKNASFGEFDDNATVATEATDLTAIPDSSKDIFASRILENKPETNTFDLFRFNEQALEEVLKMYFCNASISDVDPQESADQNSSKIEGKAKTGKETEEVASPLKVKEEKTRVKMFLASRIDQLRKSVKKNKSASGDPNKKSSRSLEKAMMAQFEKIAKSTTSQVKNEGAVSKKQTSEITGIWKTPEKDSCKELEHSTAHEKESLLISDHFLSPVSQSPVSHREPVSNNQANGKKGILKTSEKDSCSEPTEEIANETATLSIRDYLLSHVKNEKSVSKRPANEKNVILKTSEKESFTEPTHENADETTSFLISDYSPCRPRSFSDSQAFCNSHKNYHFQCDMLCGCLNISNTFHDYFEKSGKNQLDLDAKISTEESGNISRQPATVTEIETNYSNAEDEIFEEFEIIRKSDGKPSDRDTHSEEVRRTYMVEDKLHTDKAPRFLLRGRGIKSASHSIDKEATSENIHAASHSQLMVPAERRDTRLKKLFRPRHPPSVDTTTSCEKHDDLNNLSQVLDKGRQDESKKEEKNDKSIEGCSSVWNILEGKATGATPGTASNRSIEMTTENGTKTIQCTPEEEPLEHSNLANNLAVLLMTAQEAPTSSPGRALFQDGHPATDFSAIVSPSSYDSYLSPLHSLSFDSAQTYDAGDCFVTENFVHDTLSEATSLVSGKFKQAVVGIDTGTSNLFSTDATIDDMWLAKVVLRRYATSNGMTVDELIEDVCDKMDALDKTVFRVQ